MSLQISAVANPSVLSIGALLTSAQAMLEDAGIEETALEAGWLLESVLELSPLMQRVRHEQQVTAAQRMQMEQLGPCERALSKQNEKSKRQKSRRTERHRLEPATAVKKFAHITFRKIESRTIASA